MGCRMDVGREIWDAGHEIWDAGCEIWAAGWMQDVRFGIQDVRFGLQAVGLLAIQAASEPPALPPLPLFPNAAWDGIPELAAGARRALQRAINLQFVSED